MKYIINFILSIIIPFAVIANDGAFYASGNHLIPMQETDISLRKEILTIRKVSRDKIQVRVYYEFYNPTVAKQLKVGFEAFSPAGDVDGTPIDGKHPNMRDFTVHHNSKALLYQVSIVTDSVYIKNGFIQEVLLDTFQGNKSGNYVDFFYVYHFDMTFQQRKNIIEHTYEYDLSGGIDYHFYFEYVLTTAERWANKQIDDFTLILDMGPFQTFVVQQTFFDSKYAWTILGTGKSIEIQGTPNTFYDKDALKFYIRNGSAIFTQKNFKLKGDLFVFQSNIT